MKKIYCVIALGVFLSSQAMGQASISLAPSEAFLNGAPGSTVSHEFTVINDGSTPYVLGCLFNDVWYEGESTVSGDLGTIKERQAGYNFQCSPNRVLVPPKYVQRIKVVGVVPKDQTGEYFTRFYAQMLPADEIKKSEDAAPRATIGYSAKVGALIGITADGTAKLSSDVLEPKIKNEKRFSSLHFKLKNTGNVHFGGQGSLILTDAADKVVEKLDAKVPFMYPGQIKTLSLNLSDPVAKGKYKALLSLKGEEGRAAVSKEFSVVVP